MMSKEYPNDVQMMPLGSMPLSWEGGGWWVDVKEFKYWFASPLSYLFLLHYAGTVLLDAMMCFGRRPLHVENIPPVILYDYDDVRTHGHTYTHAPSAATLAS